MVIRKLNRKQAVDGVLNLTGSDINNATTTEKGVVQVGNGLNVEDGVIRVRQKLLYVRPTANIETGGSGFVVKLDKVVINDGYEYNTSSGEFTLEGGKRYRIEFITSIENGDWLSLILADSNGNSLDLPVGAIVNANYTLSISPMEGVKVIFEPPSTGRYRIQVNARSGEPRIKANNTSLIITEI